MIQRDDMGLEVGGGFRTGNSCTPVADSCQCMAKPIQYCKANKTKQNKTDESVVRVRIKPRDVQVMGVDAKHLLLPQLHLTAAMLILL